MIAPLTIRLPIVPRRGAPPIPAAVSPPRHPMTILINAMFSLITSLLIAGIYASLIRFLNRPDLSQLYLSPQSSTGSFAAPAWERMTFPDFAAVEKKDASAITAAGMSLAMPLFPISPKLEVITLTPPGPVYIPGHRCSASSEITLVPAAAMWPKSGGPSSVIVSLPSAVLNDFHPDTKASVGDEDEISSFRGMLLATSCPEEDETDERTIGCSSRAATPDDSGRIQSMASLMNRRTSYFLVWFPLTVSLLTETMRWRVLIRAASCYLHRHKVSGSGVSADLRGRLSLGISFRFAYFAVHRSEGPMLEALTLVAIMGHGIADVIIFGASTLFGLRRKVHATCIIQDLWRSGEPTKPEDPGYSLTASPGHNCGTSKK